MRQEQRPLSRRIADVRINYAVADARSTRAEMVSRALTEIPSIATLNG